MTRKNIFAALVALCTCCSMHARDIGAAKHPAIEKQVEKTLARMTLDEKVGQMVELVVDLFGDTNKTGHFAINEKKADTLFAKSKIGSILNAPNTIAPTAQQWQQHLAVIQRLSMKHIGIPCIYGLDQNHGSTYTQGGTLFPQNINLAASFNRRLARLSAAATAYETRAVSVPWTYSPTVDLGRDPRWPRIWENFGEDAYLNAEMGRQMVLGFQGNNPNAIGPQNVAATMKHYMGYGVPWSGKDRTPAQISPAELREKHFEPFLEGIRAGALSVMVNSASVNGVPVHANAELLNQWLKQETGWDGVLLTDWADVNNLWQRERVAANKKEALALAVNAGIDMIMEPYAPDACLLLKQLAQEGGISMARIDDAVRRILRMKYRLNLFAQPTQRLKDYPKFGGSEFAKLAFDAAVESMVLLKNDNNTLPLNTGKRILLVGPNANQMRCLNGGWSYTWQGHLADSFATAYNTIYKALCKQFGANNVTLAQGVTYNEQGKYWEENPPRFDEAVQAAANADVIVACIGENSYTETPGNLSDLTLSANQRTLVSLLAKTGKPIVLVLNEGRPRIIADIVPLASAVVHAFLPGNYGGDALAALLAGQQNFSGKLPYTYPSEINSLNNYDFKKSEETETMAGAYDYNARITCQWGFGHGLSYTGFAYTNLRVDKPNFNHNDTLQVCVDVTNTGMCVGKESVLLFASDIIASSTPDGRRLRGFEKVELRPGETKTVTIALPASQLAFVAQNGKWRLEAGDFNLAIANQNLMVHCTQTYQWETPNR